MRSPTPRPLLSCSADSHGRAEARGAHGPARMGRVRPATTQHAAVPDPPSSVRRAVGRELGWKLASSLHDCLLGISTVGIMLAAVLQYVPRPRKVLLLVLLTSKCHRCRGFAESESPVRAAHKEERHRRGVCPRRGKYAATCMARYN